MHRILVPVTVILAALGVACSSSNQLTTNVTVETGQLAGVAGSTADVKAFKGIPFAAAPVGELRWTKPQPAAKWDGVRAADKFGPQCMQSSLRGAPAEGISEDCLNLNVWTAAASPEERRPVMVWIYGGGYYVGAGSLPNYDGDALSKKGAVVVTFNYRLGPFGFFSHPELTKESGGQAAANFGVMDAVAALEWVQRNIAAFGGDPSRVTIFGESAGAGLIANLMVTPQAKGLFHRVSGESSAWNTVSVGRLETLADAEQAGVKFAEAQGAATLADLRAKSAEEILMGGRGTGPVVDGVWIPDDPGKLFNEGQVPDVPVLVGSNRDESFGGNVASAADYRKSVEERYGSDAAAFLKVYPGKTDEEARDSAFTAGRDQMAWVMRNWANLAAKSGTSKSYLYYFTHQPPASPNGKGGFGAGSRGTAVHTSEIVYVFDNLNGNRAWTDTDRKVAETMSQYWVNFAAAGDPNGEGLPAWPAFDAGAADNAMVFGDEAHAGPVLGPEQAAAFQAYYDSLYAKKD